MFLDTSVSSRATTSTELVENHIKTSSHTSRPAVEALALKMLKLFSVLLSLSFLGHVAALPYSDVHVPYVHSSRSSSLIRSRGVKQPSSRALAPNIGIAELYSEDFDNAFITNLTVGGQELLVIVDTGSSDTCEFLRACSLSHSDCL